MEREARTILTPEGIPLDFTLAQVGDRAAAFLIDLLILFGALVVVYALLGFAGAGDVLIAPLLLLVAFFAQNFYFPFFETRWQGATPGKRSVGIRVIDRKGGPLTAGAVLARNLVRDVEVWVPLQLVLAGQTVWPDAPGWARLAASVWGLVFMFLPSFNRDRLRAGDLVGGTLVVKAPKALLLPDVAAEARESTTRFSDEQLGVYGIYELQVLEDLLRASPSLAHDAAVHTVYERITKKIGWTAPANRAVERERFLTEFYAALRAHLERKALFGKRKEDKYG